MAAAATRCRGVLANDGARYQDGPPVLPPPTTTSSAGASTVGKRRLGLGRERESVISFLFRAGFYRRDRLLHRNGLTV